MLVAALLFACCLSAPSEVVIDADTITLGALIPFSTSDPRASVALGYAPNPGLSRRIPKYDIIRKLTAAGLPVEDLQIPETVLVQRRAASLDRDQVTRAILDAFTRQFSGASVEITSVEVPPVQVGTGPLEISASLPARFDPSTPVFVRIDIRGTSFSRNAFVRTTVRIETEQPVLKNPIAAHGEIQTSDIEWKLSPVRGDVADQMAGMLAKRDLQPGQVLTKDLLYMPLYVRKGDAVTVKATSGGITIAATMRARASGRFGETIPVEHLTGQGSTTARIVGQGTLETISNVGPTGQPAAGAASWKGDLPAPPRSQVVK